MTHYPSSDRRSVTGRSELEFVTSVVPVLETRGGTIVPRGTAFFVSNQGILITARHVVDGAFDDDVLPGEHAGAPGEFFFVVVPGGESPQVLGHRASVRVTHVSFEARRSDVAILRVDMTGFPTTSLRHLRSWPIAHNRPTQGEECFCAGYANMEVGSPVDPTGVSPDLEWTQQLVYREGPVGEVHPSGRDSALAPHPCFEMIVPTNPGMSGGPVFTNDGIVGVVSVGTSGEHGPVAYSLAALIASCYHLGVQFDLGEGLNEYMFNELIARGAIVASGPRTGMRTLGERLEVVWLDEHEPPG